MRIGINRNTAMYGYLGVLTTSLISRLGESRNLKKIMIPNRVNHFKTTIFLKNTMKKINWKSVINFIITVLTAVASSFCVQSCTK